MRIIDTNLLLRYYLQDGPQKADAVERLFRSKKHKLIIPDMAIAEMVWVLLSGYKKSRSQATKAVEGLLSLQNIELNHEVISKALETFKSVNVDWIDAYLAAAGTLEGHNTIYSFDRDFDKISGVRRLEPK